MRRGVVALGMVMVLSILNAGTASAQIETLVMPGPVIEGHAEYETVCKSCHQAFQRTRQRVLCIKCHEDIGADIEASAGYHGLNVEASTAPCASCHTDHEGRDAEIILLDEDRFDHDVTDFHLAGKHAEIECSACHVDGAKHRQAPQACIACHEADNPHGDTLGTECADCHNAIDWKDVDFDHDTTDYALIGKHVGPACLDCHADDTFRNTPTTCFGCHAGDDAHDGRSGQECENCHNPTGWDDTSFDHARDTDFPLDGAHAEKTCGDCHGEDPFADELDMACVSCHLEDDEHEGHNGGQCETCHASSAWTDLRFDHDIDTDYALLGAHSDAACRDCHVEPIYEVPLQTDCLACHEDDDAHEGSQGTACKDCHNERAWADEVFFDHDLTRFPLLGSHAETECDGCHDSHVFSDAPDQCIDCHAEEDAHEGRFGETCTICHSPVAWEQWFFDHDRQTDFRLDGAHKTVACEACHRQSLALQTRLGERCVDCHRADDIHNGEFGTDCARCHSADSFLDVSTIH